MQRYEHIPNEVIPVDKDILDYCFSYNGKKEVKTSEFKDYILDKNLVKFCMDQLSRNVSQQSCVRIPQCTIPTFVLYNSYNYKFLIDYAKFESWPKYKELGDLLTESMQTKTTDGQIFAASILISPRIFYSNSSNEVIKCLKTDTQLIKEELDKLEKFGSLFVILPEAWLTTKEDEKWQLIKEGDLATVLKLPHCKMQKNRNLVWLHFIKERPKNDPISVIDENSTLENTDYRKLSELVKDNKKTLSIDDFIKRNTVECLYEEYLDIIDRRFPENNIKIRTTILENILIPLHSNLNTEIKENAEYDIRTYLLEPFLNSCVDEHLITVVDSKESLNTKINKLKDFLKEKFKEQEDDDDQSKTPAASYYITNMLHNLRCFGNNGHNSKQTNESPIKDCGYINNVLSCCFNYFCIIKWYDKFLNQREEEKDVVNDNSSIQDRVSKSLPNIPQEKEGKENGDTQNVIAPQDGETYYVVKELNGTKYCDYKGKKAKFSSNYPVKVGEKRRNLVVEKNNFSDKLDFFYYIKSSEI